MSAIAEQTINADSRVKERDASNTTSQNPEKFWIVFWASVGIACLPFLVPYGMTLWRQDLYQYFPFVFFGVGYLTYLRWDRTWAGPRGKLGWTIAGMGAVVLAVAALMHSTWLGNIAFVTLGFAFLYSQRAIDGHYLGYLAVPLVMLIRIPQLHATSLVVRLQQITTGLSDLLLDFLAVPHDTFANVLTLPGKELFVAEACSGIQSAFTMCFVALLVIVWQRRPLILIPVYIVFALMFAVMANTIRVTLIALAEVWYGLDWTEGFAHDGVGYFSLAIAIGTLMSFDRLCSLVFHPLEVSVGKRGPNPLVSLWNWTLGYRTNSYGETGYGWNEAESAESTVKSVPVRPAQSKPLAGYVIGGLIVVSGLAMVVGMAVGRSDFRPIVAKDALLFEPPADLLNGRIGVLAIGDHEMVRDGSDPQLGLNADLWRCGTPQTMGQVVMSQPYVGWHELCVCYEVQEWKLEKRYNLPIPDGKPIAVGEFKKGENSYGYLFFTAIDSDGTIPTPPSYTLFGRILAPFGPLITDDFAETSGSAQTVMLQMWTVTEQPLEQQEISEIARSISDIRSTARDALVTQQQSLLAKK